jgi:hypothetical protein
MKNYNMSGVMAGKVMRFLVDISKALFVETMDQDSKSEIESQFIRDQNLKTQMKWADLKFDSHVGLD